MTGHLLQGNGVSVNIFKYLCIQSLHETRFSFRIASTVVFRMCPIVWYENVRERGVKGITIRQKPGNQMDVGSIYRHFGRKQRNTVSDVVCCFVDQHGDRADHEVSYMTQKNLHDFLFNENAQRYGFLQEFIYPGSDHSEMVQAVWSPRVVVSLRRMNNTRMSNTTVSNARRSTTFDGPSSSCSEVLCTKATNIEATEICNQIVRHVTLTEPHVTIRRLVVYFRRDARDQLHFMFTSSIRLTEASCGKVRVAPVCLRPNFDCRIPATHSYLRRKLDDTIAAAKQDVLPPPCPSVSTWEVAVAPSIKVAAVHVSQPLCIAGEVIDDQLYCLASSLLGAVGKNRKTYARYMLTEEKSVYTVNVVPTLLVPDEAVAYLEPRGTFPGYGSVLERLGMRRITGTMSYQLAEKTAREGTIATLQEFRNPCKALSDRAVDDEAQHIAEVWHCRKESREHKELLHMIEGGANLRSVTTVVSQSPWVAQEWAYLSTELSMTLSHVRLLRNPKLRHLTVLNKIACRNLAKEKIRLVEPQESDEREKQAVPETRVAQIQEVVHQPTSQEVEVTQQAEVTQKTEVKAEVTQEVQADEATQNKAKEDTVQETPQSIENKGEESKELQDGTAREFNEEGSNKSIATFEHDVPSQPVQNFPTTFNKDTKGYAVQPINIFKHSSLTHDPVTRPTETKQQLSRQGSIPATETPV